MITFRDYNEAMVWAMIYAAAVTVCGDTLASQKADDGIAAYRQRIQPNPLDELAEKQASTPLPTSLPT